MGWNVTLLYNSIFRGSNLFYSLGVYILFKLGHKISLLVDGRHARATGLPCPPEEGRAKEATVAGGFWQPTGSSRPAAPRVLASQMQLLPSSPSNRIMLKYGCWGCQDILLFLFSMTEPKARECVSQTKGGRYSERGPEKQTQNDK